MCSRRKYPPPLNQMCKKTARDCESLHERKQLSRQWRNTTKARRKLRIEREVKEKARKRANEHRRFKADRYKFAKELFDPPNSAQSPLVWIRLLRILRRQIPTSNAQQCCSLCLDGRGQKHLSTRFCYWNHYWLQLLGRRVSVHQA